MGEYLRSADQILRAAGLEPEAATTAELLKLLADRARDWADNAAALGATMDPASATRMAAQAICVDPMLLNHLEALEAGASAIMERLRSSVAEGNERFASQRMPLRRRRWGQDSQPCGDIAATPFKADVHEAATDELRSLRAENLLGLPAYDTQGSFLGQVEAVVLANQGGQAVGLKLLRS